MFDKISIQKRLKPFIGKLLNYITSKKITFEENDGLENVVFKSGSKEVKIAHQVFYRYSGLTCVYKEDKAANTMEPIDVDDDMFMTSYMKSILDKHFELIK